MEQIPSPGQLPGSVRAARAIIFVMAAIGVVGTVVLIGMGRPIATGANATGYLFFWALAVTACFFARGRGGVRITATVFAVLEGFAALGSMAFDGSGGKAATEPGVAIVRLSPGPFGLIAVIVIVVLLYRDSAGRWFKRPATVAGVPAVPPDYPAAQGVSEPELVRPAPVPGAGQPPRDPRKPLLRRPATLGLLIAIVVVVGVVVAVAVTKTMGSDEISAGDCVGTRDGESIDLSGVELVTMDCSDPAAQAKVLARLEGTNNTLLCREYPDYNDAYTDSDDTQFFVLCLRAFS
ncbi:LppU/SCO3897 family protein [Nocardia wallacei]|uniref:LppU/SCO3897 family protein n=1 Tax=Nocardia wallacei TaxID=480035 RepID=UPI0024538B3C|nr:hypothetical protein [Nocardia wallacei]